jgi:hypothetical protein
MIAIADRLGIERLCVYLGLAFTEDPSPETFRRDNDQVLQAIGADNARRMLASA